MIITLTGWEAAVAEALAAPPAGTSRSHPVYLVQGLRRVAPDAFASPADALAYVRELYPGAMLAKSGESIVASYRSGRGDTFAVHYVLKPAY